MKNISLGLLGHVDSGKTSVAKKLSTIESTSAFDKSPQSKERGITIDLGFSAFQHTVGEDPRFSSLSIQDLQFTLVDCPGHASLLRTIIGGAHIVDIILLVIDVTKGIQTQTAECLVVAEILNRPLVVILNKIDAIPGEHLSHIQSHVTAATQLVQKKFRYTRWPAVPIIPFIASPEISFNEASPPLRYSLESIVGPQEGVSHLKACLVELTSHILPLISAYSNSSSTFLLYVDHCFPLSGQGTVLTGTVMSGRIQVGDSIFFPALSLVRRVKQLQMFHKPISRATKGDRIGICVTQFSSDAMERGVVCGVPSSDMNRKKGIGGVGFLEKRSVSSSLSSLTNFPKSSFFIAEVIRIPYHNHPCRSGGSFHLTVGHLTVMGTARFFSFSQSSQNKEALSPSREVDFRSSNEEQWKEWFLHETFEFEEMLPQVDVTSRRYLERELSSKLMNGIPLTDIRLDKKSSFSPHQRMFAVILLEKPLPEIFLRIPGPPNIHWEEWNKKYLSSQEGKEMLHEEEILPSPAIFIAARHDLPPNKGECRLAFTGSIHWVGSKLALSEESTVTSDNSELWKEIRVVRRTQRFFEIKRIINPSTCVISTNEVSFPEGMTKNTEKEAVGQHTYRQVTHMLGQPVFLIPPEDLSHRNLEDANSSPIRGEIIETFGSSGKLRVIFEKDIFPEDLFTNKCRGRGFLKELKKWKIIYERVKYPFRNSS